MLFDSTAMSYAAYYTTGSLSYKGKQTGVIYGFLKRVANLAYKYKTSNLIFCWDAGVTWRHFNYDGYKRDRQHKKEMQTEAEKIISDSLLLQSLQLNHEILPRMGLVNTFCFKNYEADDLIGALVDKLHDRKIIVSSDTDFYQCLDRADMYLIKQKKLLTKKSFMRKYNVYPDNWAYAKAIGGCNSDSVIGIDGVGDPKSPGSKALKYIRGEMGPGKVRDRIESSKGKEIVEKNLPIVTIPYMLDLMPRMLIRRHRVTRKKLLQEFDRWHFSSFMEREAFAKWKEIFDL